MYEDMFPKDMMYAFGAGLISGLVVDYFNHRSHVNQMIEMLSNRIDQQHALMLKVFEFIEDLSVVEEDDIEDVEDEDEDDVTDVEEDDIEDVEEAEQEEKVDETVTNIPIRTFIDIMGDMSKTELNAFERKLVSNGFDDERVLRTLRELKRIN